MRRLALLHVLAALGAAGCSGGGEDVDPPDHPWVNEARIEFPTALELHTKVISRSCGPLDGVCHNNKEFPDLHTPGNFVTAVARPCNVDVEDPEQIFDGCEPPADEVSIGGFRTKLSWIAPYDDYDPDTFEPFRLVRFAEPSPVSDDRVAGAILRGGSEYLAISFSVEQGNTEGRLIELYDLPYQEYQKLATVRGGDPNGNGVFGGEEGWAEIMPGRPDRSYLVGRVTGTVPGSRMPLANQPLSNPEYVALHCWIESIGSHPRPEDRIDYDRCEYARAPLDYEID